jgi:hypothetical protein
MLAFVTWFFSQPPWWKLGPLKIYMPSFFMYKLMPMFRAYSRFGIVLMLAIAVLAGYGLKYLLERFKSAHTKFLVAVLFCGLILFEFWNYPPYKVVDVSRVPAVYYWLKEQPPDTIISEYPSDATYTSELYKFYQTIHEKKTINCAPLGTHANKVSQAIMKLSDPKTAGILKWMGVKLVLVHKGAYLQTELVEDRHELQKIPTLPGIKFIKSFGEEKCPDNESMCTKKTGPIDVYEVVAAAINPEPEK